MNYEVIATLGPSSDQQPVWEAMLAAGASGFRLNTSHLSLPELEAWLNWLEPFLSRVSPQPVLVLDLQGSKWRLGGFAPFSLAPGQPVELVHAASTDQAGTLPVPHADFFKAAEVSGEEIVLNDARIRLKMENLTGETVKARVLRGGPISPRKGITFVDSGYRQEALSPRDKVVVESTQQFHFVRYAISYIKDAAEMKRYREIFGPRAQLIAKIERRPAVNEASQIAASANEVWLCRGDLGAELGVEGMAQAAHRFSAEVTSLPVPALLAGQVLEHMTYHATPTRSEMCYLYDTLMSGYKGVVLSDETAIGHNPVESCRMAAIFKKS